MYEMYEMKILFLLQSWTFPEIMTDGFISSVDIRSLAVTGLSIMVPSHSSVLIILSSDYHLSSQLVHSQQRAKNISQKYDCDIRIGESVSWVL